MSTTTRKRTTAAARKAPAPPAAAVAADAHWAAKIERIRAQALPEQELTLCLDQDAQQRLSRAETALMMAQAAARARFQAEPPSGVDEDVWVAQETTAAQAEVDQAEAEVTEASVTFWFRCLKAADFEALIKAHPPTEEAAEQGAQFNEDTFAAPLVAACSFDRAPDGSELPGMSVEMAEELIRELPPGDAMALYQTPFHLCQRTRARLGGLGKG